MNNDHLIDELQDLGCETPQAKREPDAPRQATVLPLTPRAKRLFPLAERISRQMGWKYVGTEHFLLALFKINKGLGNRMLKASGAKEMSALKVLKDWNEGKMNKLEFDKIGFGSGMHATYMDHIYAIVSVNFPERLLGLTDDATLDPEYTFWVREENAIIHACPRSEDSTTAKASTQI